jgi:hypothetical protein
MALDLNALATRAAQQGQSMLDDYTNKANTYSSQYNDYQRQADAANQNVQNYTNYMQNEGSAGNQFHGEFNKQLGDLGYTPEAMSGARANLNQATGALSAYSDFANTAASKWGMNAGGFAAANAGALNGKNNNIASNQGVVNSLSDLYKTAQTGANQFTGQVIQGEHETLAGLQTTFSNATNQRDSAASMMTFITILLRNRRFKCPATAILRTGAICIRPGSATNGPVISVTVSGSRPRPCQYQAQNYMGSDAYKKTLAGTPTQAQLDTNKAKATAPTQAQLAQSAADVAKATAYTKKTSSIGGMLSMSLPSLIRGHF